MRPSLRRDAGTVTPAGNWYRAGMFLSEDEAHGALLLAYQQWLDGCGDSIFEWVGLSEAEIADWLADGKLPKDKNVAEQVLHE